MSGLHDLAAAYALDALDDAERAEFEAHLPTCPDCRREIAEFEATGAVLGSATVTPPPPDLKSSVLAAIAGVAQQTGGDPHEGASPPTPDDDPRPVDEPVTVADVVPLRRRPMRWALGAAAAVLLAVVAIGVVLGTRPSAVSVDDVYAAADVEVVTLTGDGSSVRVAWSDELDRVVVDGDAVPGVGPGSVYELWAIVGDTPVPAGLIDHDGGGLSTLLETDRIDGADVDAWGITIEPAGGSEAPTLPILYYAEV